MTRTSASLAAQRLSSSPQARKRSVQRRGKGLLGPCIVGRWPSRNEPSQSRLIHEVAYREALTDCFGRVLLAARIEHRDRLGNQLRCQRDILRNDQVSSGGVRGDVLVGHVWTSIHPDGTHKAIPGRCLQALVRHQDDFDGQSLGERNTSSLTSRGAASASTQIFRPTQLLCS